MRQNQLSVWQKRLLRFAGRSWVSLTALGFVVLLLYLPSLANWASVDDLTHLRAAVYHEAPFKTFFRPLERWINELDVDLLGYGDLRFTLAVNLLGFFVTIGATYFLGKILYPGARIVRLFAAAIVAFSSLSTTTTIQIDALSQQFATVFPLLFLLTLLQATRRTSPGLFILAFSFATLALLSKETSLGLLAAAPLATLLITFRSTDRPILQKLTHLLVHYGVLAVIVCSYLGLRIALGYTFGGESSQYTLSLSPLRIVKNAGFYFAGLAYIGGSTLDLLPVLKLGRAMISTALSIALFGVSLLGFLRLLFTHASGRVTLLALFLLTLAGSVPVIVTEQVSELYTYSSLPYFALIIGVTFVGGCKQLSIWLGRSATFTATALFSCCLFAWIAAGTYGKLEAHDHVSDQSWRYFTQVESFIGRKVDERLNLCWSNVEDRHVPAYSVYMRPSHLLASRALVFAIGLTHRQSGTNQISILGESSGTDAKLISSCDYMMTVTEREVAFFPNG